jgi:hypothetical protein
VTSVVLGASLAGWMRGICLDGVQITVNIWKKFFYFSKLTFIKSLKILRNP